MMVLRRPKRRPPSEKRAVSLGAGLRVTGRRARDVAAAAAGPAGAAAQRLGRGAADGAERLAGAIRVRVDAVLDRVWNLAERVRPRPVLFAVSAAAAVVLGLAQFADFRIVSAVTQDLDRTSTGEAHAYALLPVAVLGLATLYWAAGDRPRLARGFAALGGLAVVVSLGVDLPQGSSREGFERLYDGVDSRLAGGFYAQLAAGVAMLACGALLARTAPRREPRR